MTLSARETHHDYRAAGALSGLIGWLGFYGRNGRDRRHALAELAAMEDWQLEDVGLTRPRLEREMAAAVGLTRPRLEREMAAAGKRHGRQPTRPWLR